LDEARVSNQSQKAAMNRFCPRGLAMSLAGLVFTLATAQADALPQRLPNFVFLLADDLGWGDLHCYGHPHIKTPSLDQLAKAGTLFTQFYVNGSVCSPSRCAFMTSHFPARHAIHGHFAIPMQNKARDMPNWLGPRVPTVTRLLQQAGYATGHFGKWHLGNGPGAPEPKEYGIDDYRVTVGNGPTWTNKGADLWPKSCALIVDETLRFITAHTNQPFYVNAWFLLPHAPLNPSDEQMEIYDRFQPELSIPHKSAAQIYYASVTDLDTQVGRLLKGLDALDLTGTTVVIFSSDNGPEDIHINNAGHSGIGSAGPFRGRKRSLYEGGVRVPFIVRWPGHVPAGRFDSTSVTCGVDFLPTVCRLAGVPLPAALDADGEDVSDIWLDRPRQRTKPLLWEWRFQVFGEPFHRSPILAIRDGDWKLLMNPDRSRVELYDIPRDPTEMSNLAEAQKAIVRRLSKQVLAWQKTLPAGMMEDSAGRNEYPWPGATNAVKRAPPGRKVNRMAR
jgi:arylsulfatase A-like enzyme